MMLFRTTETAETTTEMRQKDKSEDKIWLSERRQNDDREEAE